ncbi:hypothetical protein ACU8MT_32475 (plasmid) [Rhizobium leguminosarum]|uniref:SIR2-like domain-containing protein n=1 Tax=Rhizobium leguminosarum TaxID=384 RepID=A0A7M3DLC1_RHILE|nr:hypothetical protein [Rhizobium leguminosarum]TAY43793.1 hypothetical protein ELH90_31340 [Rhizobium leguminosarum]
MFADNTVFIIGAGASVEFGMPVGSKLTEQIKQNCKFRFEFGNLKEGAMPIFDYYRNTYDLRDPAKAKEVQARFDLMAQIHRSIDMAESIDEYIFRYSDNPLVAEVGKLHIAYAISKAESECLLSDKAKFSHDTDGFESASKKWIFTFAKALMTGVKASEIKTIGNNITIICFNYDRCIEHYLEHAICRTYAGVNLETAREIVSNINIIHPYGVLGPFEAFPFGSTKRFADMGRNLITWSETVRDEQITAEIDYGIRNADTLVFMGFGYAKQNMDLMRTDREPKRPLGLADESMASKRIYSTAFGFKNQVHRKITENIIKLWTDNREMQDERDINIEGETVTCREFIQTNLMNLVE